MNQSYDLFVLVLTILLLPRTKTVTVFVFAHSSMTSILSRVVPKVSSRTRPALPSLAAVRSSNRGTILPLVAMAINYTPDVSHRWTLEPSEIPRSQGHQPIERQGAHSALAYGWLRRRSPTGK